MPVMDFIENLECPVCKEHFTGRVFMCAKGHSVCESCREHLQDCPLCKAIFPGTRNYIVEQLSQNAPKMEEMQRQMESMVAQLQKAKEEQKVVVEKKKEESEVSQVSGVPQEPEIHTEIGPQNYKKNLFGGPVQGKGHFKCLFPKCKQLLPICRFLNHLRQIHKENLVEEKLFVDEFHGRFEILAQETLAVKAYNLSKFGIFFLFITQKRLPKGSHEINAWVQCVAPDIVANKLRYTIKLSLNKRTVSYSSVVYGSRKLADNFREKGHCLKFDMPSSIVKYEGQLQLKHNKGPAVHSKKTVVTNDRT